MVYTLRRLLSPVSCLAVALLALAPDPTFSTGATPPGQEERSTPRGRPTRPSTQPDSSSIQTLTAARQIRGQVRKQNLPMANVAVHANGVAPALTGPDGFYLLSLPAGWTGAIGPLATDHAFLPFQRTFLTESIDAQPVDFEAFSTNPPGPRYYVAPYGIDRPGIPGTIDNPWQTAEYAIKRVGGGATIILRDGVYRQRITVYQEGRPFRPTIVRAEHKWAAIIEGSENHNVLTQRGAHWVIIDGLQVRRAGITGIKVHGDHTIIRNCWIHSSTRAGIEGHGIDSNRGVVDLRIENCLIERNGHIDPSTGRLLGHGVYAHGDGLLLRNNVFRRNTNHGIHLYQEGAPGVTGSTVCGNLCYGNGSRGILVDNPADVRGARPNVIVNNTCVNNGHDGVTVCSGFTDRPNIVANNVCMGNYIKPGVLRPIGVYRLGPGKPDSPHVILDGNICDIDLRACPDQEFTHVRYANGNMVLRQVPFAVPARGAFWLLPDTPVPGVGNAQCLPLADFWERPQSDWKSAYRGAFPPNRPRLKDQGDPEYRDYWTLSDK